MSDRGLVTQVAEDVMGWRIAEHPEKHGTGQWMSEYGSPVYYKPNGQYICMSSFHPDIEIDAAMQVVEKFIDMGGRVSLRGMRFVTDGMTDEYKPGWRVNFYRFRRDVPPGTRFSFDEEDESLPLAICRAALAAVKDQG